MYSASSYSYADEKNLFRQVDHKAYLQEKKKDKIADSFDFILVMTPIVISFLWVLFVGLTWDSKKGLSIDSIFEIVILVVFAFFLSLVPAIAVIGVWSRLKPNTDRLAKKVFTKTNIENSNQEILGSYSYSSSKIQKIFRSKLRVSSDQIDYMKILVAEGYKGSLKNLAAIVKKL